jgi:hypothetical protein
VGPAGALSQSSRSGIDFGRGNTQAAPMFALRRVQVLILLAALTLGLTGCVTNRKYRLAKSDTPPAQVLGWTATAPAGELTLQSVIIFKGPGSWKREARWDEYVVRLRNPGPQSMVLGSAELIDTLGHPQRTGDDPWELEKRSSTNWQRYGQAGLRVIMGAGAGIVILGAAEGAALASIQAGGAVAGTTMLTSVVPALFLVDVTAVAIIDHQNKGKVAEECQRRRLACPLTLASGEETTRSLFFPVTPGPQRLHLYGQSGGHDVTLTLELPGLAGLHLEPRK